MVVGVYYALLSQEPLENGFDDIRAASTWVDGATASIESIDSLNIGRGDGGSLVLQTIDLRQSHPSAGYATALLLRFDLEHLQSAALSWEVLLAVLSEGYRYDVWNAAYPARTIAKCGELRPLKLLDTHGYVMRPPEFDCLAERVPKQE